MEHFSRIISKIKQYLPTIVSIGNLACGFGAIIFIINNELSYAAWLIITAMVFDGMDGQIARLIKTKIAWGRQIDSLADMVTFGIVPAFLIGSINAFNSHIAIWFVCFFFTLCTAIRLARHNAQDNSDTEQDKYFTGLPSTLAGGTIASLILLDGYLKTTVGIQIVSKSIPSITFILGILMVSKIQYIKIVDVLRKKHNPASLLTIIGVFFTLLVLFILYPSIMLPLGFCVYVIIGNHGVFRKKAIHTT
ncbi:MAG: CDP-diacylglycerol-serine O-phosphatidyltransferase [Candidatus Scalindua rubra]|uniref:CDP-diacylglycerol--serine O-phosphatidyltransferase n=1 Tax=Candidatus Scalindua rubra TaxID=1872076 RepID=A0A1E3XEI8_9BACT|nr:MAG: CDP-diacylglycerol-serine O-phosphatidyltransferase [Candidatus Scalindua rubra]